MPGLEEPASLLTPCLGRGHRPRAGDGGDKDGGERDWDAKWREFVKVRVPSLCNCAPSTPLTRLHLCLAQTFQFDPEDFVDRPATPPGWGGAAKEDIRRSERQVLAAWTSPTFAKAGILVVVATLFVFVVVVGPPPSDGRCTLPFCG